MSQKTDSVNRTILIAAVLSLCCSIIVSVSAVSLRPIQEKNQALDKKTNILMAASLYEEGDDVEKKFAKYVKPKVVDLKSGSYVDGVDPLDYDQYKMAKVEEEQVLLDPRDLSGIRMIARYAVVFEIYADGKLDQVVLPIHGKGLWSTLLGFVAVSSDTNTINGLGYYSHAETPGLGGEVDNPKWKALWKGKKVRDEQGKIQVEVVKGGVNPASKMLIHQVDGLSGATITSRGVSEMLNFWFGELGFQQYLQRIKNGGM